MGSKMSPGVYDCYDAALPDEPMFIVLGRDANAPKLVKDWALNRLDDIALKIRPVSDIAKCIEALECAEKMKEWRQKNNGAWRQIAPPVWPKNIPEKPPFQAPPQVSNKHDLDPI